MRDAVKEYYGIELQSSQDLKTNACCTPDNMPDHIKKALTQIHEEVTSKYYGCGLVVPELLEDARVLDLGSGSGQDCYLLAQIVGESGYVVGIDMTDEQLAVANRHIDYHREKFGFQDSNVEFRKGYIEKLDEVGLESNSFDLIISNCVVNLSTDKDAVLREAYRVLKPGGEFYFSDVYSDRRIPDELVEDPVLYGECLSGALYWNDFHQLSKQNGFMSPRVFEDRPLLVGSDEIEQKVGHIGFYSSTYRLFKATDLESSEEDYGQSVTYQGGIADQAERYTLDKSHVFERGKKTGVSGNTFEILKQSRLSAYFSFEGDRSIHHGIFVGNSDSTTEGFPFDAEVEQSDCCAPKTNSTCC